MKFSNYIVTDMGVNKHTKKVEVNRDEFSTLADALRCTTNSRDWMQFTFERTIKEVYRDSN